MRTAYRRRTCRLCGDFRQDHLRRQMTDIGNRIGRVPATSGTTACMDRMEIADIRHQHCHRIRLERLTSRLCNISVLSQHDQPMPVDPSENVGQYSGAGRSELPRLRGDSRKGPYRARSGNVCLQET